MDLANGRAGMGRRAALALALPLFVFARPALAEDVPRLDIEASCRAVQPQFRDDKAARDACLQQERDARTKLQQVWAQYPAPARNTCVQVDKIGGFPSYVEVLTCLEMSKWSTEPAGTAAGGTRTAPAR